MEKRQDKLSSEMEQLLVEKPYDQLNDLERIAVDQEWSVEEYNALRMVLLESKALFVNSKDHKAPTMHPKLSDLVKKNRSRPMLWTWLEQAIHYPLPTWQPALGLLAVIAFFFSPWSNSSELMQAAEPIYVYKTDTVYSSTTDTIYKERNAQQNDAKTEVKRSRTFNKKDRSVATAANVVRTRNDVSTKTVDVPDKTAIPEAIVAFHLDTMILRQNSDTWMSRDSGHSLNEVEGIMDFFVEIH